MEEAIAVFVSKFSNTIPKVTIAIPRICQPFRVSLMVKPAKTAVRAGLVELRIEARLAPISKIPQLVRTWPIKVNNADSKEPRAIGNQGR